MKITATQNARRVASTTLVSAVVVIAGLLSSVVTAEAHGHGHGKPGKHGPKGGAHGYYNSQRVPRVIAVDHRAYYSPYVSGRTYYAPHHHYHARYRFPVFVGGAIQYQPYYYCGQSLFVTGVVALPHVAFGINFGLPGGLAVGGYYEQPYLPEDRHHYYDRDYDPDQDHDD